MIVRFKQFLNLIEIAMALGILGFGFASIMSVLPSALQSAQNSIGEDYSSNAAELFLSYIAIEAKRSGGWTIIENLPGSKPSTSTDERGRYQQHLFLTTP